MGVLWCHELQHHADYLTSQAPVLAVQLHSNHELGQHLLNLHVRLNCRDSLVQSTAEAQCGM